jgi:2-keto-4-pentenoate hydratase
MLAARGKTCLRSEGMNRDGIEAAARALAEAERAHRRIAALPDGGHPATPAEAMAIEARVLELVGREVAGWKVATNSEGVSTWGAIYAEDCLTSPARLPAERMPLRGVEGEVAFRFTRDLPARAEPYSRNEIRAVLAAFPAIEIVDSRFENYDGTPSLDRTADRMSNGGLVSGTAEPGADQRDLSNLHVTLIRNGETVLDRMGGHSRKDPLLPVIEFIHARQSSLSFRAGQFITAGTLTGVVFGEKGDDYRVHFSGLGAVEVAFS